VIAVLAYVLLALVLRFTYGTYQPTMLFAATGAIAVFGSVVLRRDPRVGRRIERLSSEFVLSLVLALFAVLLWFDPLVIGPTEALSMLAIRSATGVLAIAAIALAVFCRPGSKHSTSTNARLCLAVAWATLIFVRVQTLHAAPSPSIDVFVTNTIASDHLAAGRNPYAAEYPDVYNGAYDYDPGFFYWPAFLYWAAPFRLATSDVRVGLLAADLLAALAVWAIARRLQCSPVAAALAPLVWLSHPVSLLVLELGWIDPLLIAGVGALALAIVARRWLVVGLLLGAVAATKQYGAVASFATFVYLWSRHREIVWRTTAIAGAAWLAMVGPFLWLDAAAFYRSTIGVYAGAAVRPDALSWVAWASNRWDVVVPGALLIAFYVAALAAVCYGFVRGKLDQPRHWAGVLGLLFAAIFLLGKQAFCNYYVFASFFVLLFVVLSMADDRREEAGAKLAR
jgi:hypothetical protein